MSYDMSNMVTTEKRLFQSCYLYLKASSENQIFCM